MSWEVLERETSVPRMGGTCCACRCLTVTPGLFVFPARLLAQSRLDLCKSSDQSGLGSQQSREILHLQAEQGLQHE